MLQVHEDSLGLSSFKIFNEMKKAGYKTKEMGFSSNSHGFDITRLDSRIRLVKAFKGMNLTGYTDATICGYNAFLRVFLMHSGLEQFLEIMDIKGDNLFPLLLPYEPEIIIQQFKDADPKNKLFEALSRLVNPRLRSKLYDVVTGKDGNVFYLSAAIRHIFAHGHLTAHINGANPRLIERFCQSLSAFFIDFMDKEFTLKLEVFQRGLEGKSEKLI